MFTSLLDSNCRLQILHDLMPMDGEQDLLDNAGEKFPLHPDPIQVSCVDRIRLAICITYLHQPLENNRTAVSVVTARHTPYSTPSVCTGEEKGRRFPCGQKIIALRLAQPRHRWSQPCKRSKPLHLLPTKQTNIKQTKQKPSNTRLALARKIRSTSKYKNPFTLAVLSIFFLSFFFSKRHCSIESFL